MFVIKVLNKVAVERINVKNFSEGVEKIKEYHYAAEDRKDPDHRSTLSIEMFPEIITLLKDDGDGVFATEALRRVISQKVVKHLYEKIPKCYLECCTVYELIDTSRSVYCPKILHEWACDKTTIKYINGFFKIEQKFDDLRKNILHCDM